MEQHVAGVMRDGFWCAGGHIGMVFLRDKLLSDFTDQLKGQVTHLDLFNNIRYSTPGAVFIKQLKSNVYVSLYSIGSFRCYLYSHWLSKNFFNLSFFMNMGPDHYLIS